MAPRINNLDGKTIYIVDMGFADTHQLLTEMQGLLTERYPIMGKPVLEEIIGAITNPLSAEEEEKGFIEKPPPRLVEPDTAENLARLFFENGRTDELPIVLPTEARVAEMLKDTSRDAEEEVGKMQPSYPQFLFQGYPGFSF